MPLDPPHDSHNIKRLDIADAEERREHLVHNITNRYYTNDFDVSKEYFKDGTGLLVLSCLKKSQL